MLATLPDGSVDCCVTSPPYWGLRDYGMSGQIGLEKSPAEYVAKLVEVFREVRRVLRDEGTLWLVMGDSYATGHSGFRTASAKQRSNSGTMMIPRRPYSDGICKHKDLVGIPWRLAFALQAEGWWLRSDIIWAKPNPMPESVTDRPTKAHEYVFLLAKSKRYFYDAGAIAEKQVGPIGPPRRDNGQTDGFIDLGMNSGRAGNCPDGMRNARSVWTITPEPFPEAHFAVFPQALARRCVLAGSPVGGAVLDPFAGAMTTGVVAIKHGRRFIGIELNPEYVAMGRRRLEAEYAKPRPALEVAT